MNLPDFIYRIIGEFARLNPTTVSDLKNEATDDYAKWNKEGAKPWQKKLFKIAEHYGARTLLALIFIFLSRELKKSLIPTDEFEDNYDD